MAIMQCEKCRVRWVFDNATKILSTAKAFDKMLLTERNVKSKCKHISDLKTKPHPEQRHAEVISRSSTSNLMDSQLENECVKRRKEKLFTTNTFHYVLIAFIAFLRFDISSERLNEHTKMGNSHFCDFLLQRYLKT